MTLDKVKRGFKPSYENRIPADWRGAYPLATRCVYSLRARRILQWCEELFYGSSRLQDPQVPPMGMNYCNVPQWQTSIYANRPRRSPEYTVCCMSVWKFFQYKMVGLSVVCPPLKNNMCFVFRWGITRKQPYWSKRWTPRRGSSWCTGQTPADSLNWSRTQTSRRSLKRLHNNLLNLLWGKNTCLLIYVGNHDRVFLPH